MPEQRLVIRRPDDWHVHLRDGDMLATVAKHTAHQFGRAIVMPNLSPPITTAQQARDYRTRIMSALPTDTNFEPLLTAYLTDTMAADEIEAGFGQDVFTGPANCIPRTSPLTPITANMSPSWVFVRLNASW